MSRFSLSNGRYAAPPESRYARYIKSVTISGTDKSATDAHKAQLPGTHGTYGALLIHPKWKERRKLILHRDNHCCVHCKSTLNLEVHHRQYHFVLALKQFKPPWDYEDRLMITLCKRCHQRGHYIYNVPTINI